jgi:hypothetical protein
VAADVLGMEVDVAIEVDSGDRGHDDAGRVPDDGDQLTVARRSRSVRTAPANTGTPCLTASAAERSTMPEPRVPGGEDLRLPCGESLRVHDLDMGLREIRCGCGASHAVVVDVHPPSRFVPEEIVAVLRETVETDDEFPEFGTAHVMGMVLEEFPDRVAVADVADDGHVGYTLLWVTDFDSRRLHEVVVELLVELMDHAASHGDDDTAGEFEVQVREFDVETFVEQYRDAREFESELDRPV